MNDRTVVNFAGESIKGISQALPHVAMISRYPRAGETDSGRGLSGYTKRLAISLQRLGCRVTVIGDRIRPHEERYEEEGVWVWRTWRPGFKAIPDIESAIANLRPDIIHLQHELFVFGRGSASLVAPLLLRRLRDWKTVTTIHGVALPADLGGELRAYSSRVPHGIVRVVYRRIMKGLGKGSDLVIMHNRSIASAFSAYCTSHKAEIIPLAIPDSLPPKWTRDRALRAFGIDDRPRAVFFGYVLPYKGIDTLLAAAPELAANGVEVVVAGSDGGDDRPTHGMRAPAWGSVRRMGFIPEQMLPALFAIADVMVFPYSVGLSSSGPLAIAVAYQTPTVVSSVSTLSDDLSWPEATFRVGDPQALAATVLKVLRDEGVRRRILDRLETIRAERSSALVATRTLSCYRGSLPVQRDK